MENKLNSTEISEKLLSLKFDLNKKKDELASIQVNIFTLNKNVEEQSKKVLEIIKEIDEIDKEIKKLEEK